MPAVVIARITSRFSAELGEHRDAPGLTPASRRSAISAASGSSPSAGERSTCSSSGSPTRSAVLGLYVRWRWNVGVRALATVQRRSRNPSMA
jgi:hypothetical protein